MQPISDPHRHRHIDQAISRPAEIQTDRVAAVRSEISAGTYDTPERMDAAVDRMIDEPRLEINQPMT